jgi:hypothetical protein
MRRGDDVTKVLESAHAEDVGGQIVEPGQPIPDDADPEIVERLEAAGRIVDDPDSKPKKG